MSMTAEGSTGVMTGLMTDVTGRTAISLQKDDLRVAQAVSQGSDKLPQSKFLQDNLQNIKLQAVVAVINGGSEARKFAFLTTGLDKQTGVCYAEAASMLQAAKMTANGGDVSRVGMFKGERSGIIPAPAATDAKKAVAGNTNTKPSTDAPKQDTGGFKKR